MLEDVRARCPGPVLTEEAGRAGPERPGRPGAGAGAETQQDGRLCSQQSAPPTTARDNAARLKCGQTDSKGVIAFWTPGRGVSAAMSLHHTSQSAYLHLICKSLGWIYSSC